MMFAKMATLAVFKTKVFWNKGYDVIIYVYEVINNVLSLEDVVIRPNFGYSSISMREVIIPSIFQGFGLEIFFEGGLGSSSII